MRTLDQLFLRGLCALGAIYFLVNLGWLQPYNSNAQLPPTKSKSVAAKKVRLGLEPQFCQEDNEHVQSVLALNLTKPGMQLIKDLYKLIIKPIQTNCLNMQRIGKIFSFYYYGFFTLELYK